MKNNHNYNLHMQIIYWIFHSCNKLREKEKLLSILIHTFWSGCLVHTLNLLMHDIVKHKECGWINELYKWGHTRVNYFYGTYSKLQLLKLAKTRFASYYLTFRRLVKVRQPLTHMVTVESWEEINTDRYGANVASDTILDRLLWS